MAFKPAICTQCGANIEVDDSHEAGICPHCGTAFVVEKAINNYRVSNNYVIQNANIQGGPNLDTLLKLAERALNDNNDSEAVKYYEQVLLADPDNWKAVFYSRYCKAKDARVKDIANVAESINASIETTLDLIKTKVFSENEQKEAVDEVTTRVCTLLMSMHAAAKSHFREFRSIDSTVIEFANNTLQMCASLVTFGNTIYRLFKDKPDIAKDSVLAFKQIIVLFNEWLNAHPAEEFQSGFKLNMINNFQPLFDEANAGIKRYEPDFVFPNFSSQVRASRAEIQQNNASSGGCYVATCVYGSYDCPEVWTLRRYRDYELDEVWYGRLFIKIYYAISPSIVKLFGNKKWFKEFWKKRLDKMVCNLKNKGYEDTQYKDKY